MSRRYQFEFVLLAAVWGASFLFMRIAAPAFGPLPLMALRCAIGAAVLVPIVLLVSRPTVVDVVRRRGGSLLFAGLVNSAIPFVLFGFAALSLSAGFASILNATTPIFGAVVGYLWLHERLTPLRIIGLVVGLAGVVVLSWDKATFGADGTFWAVVGILVATACYGVAGNFAKRAFVGVDPVIVAAGSQTGALLVLLGPGIAAWPDAAPPLAAWLCALALGAVSTGLAYLLFYRLIASAGPSAAMSVTFLIPVFGVVWGMLFLGETLDAPTVVGGAIVLLGTALATGVLAPARDSRGR